MGNAGCLFNWPWCCHHKTRRLCAHLYWSGLKVAFSALMVLSLLMLININNMDQTMATVLSAKEIKTSPATCHACSLPF